MSEATEKQKLEFLENLLKMNDQIKAQYYNFIAPNKQLEQNTNEDDFESLVSEIFNNFQSINTSDFMENDYCHHGRYYYDEFDGVLEQVLDSVFEDYDIAINNHISSLQLYEAIKYLSAIYKALLLEPNISDDNYYIFGEEFCFHATDYLESKINKIVIQIQDIVFPNSSKEESIDYLAACVDNKFKLDIFTPLLKCLISDEVMANLALKYIDKFPILVKLHICKIINDDEKYIDYAKKDYKNNTEASELLLEKLSSLDRYKEYEQIAKDLFEENSRYYSPIILKNLKYEKSKDLYINALKQRLINNNSLEDYKQLKQYLNKHELIEFRRKIEQSHQKKFYVDILEYEKMYDEILKITNKEIGSYELHYFIRPVKDVFPREVFEIVKKSCCGVLKEVKRDRSTYQTMIKWLKVIIDVEQIKDELDDYIQTNLYNHQPKLPALRDELKKAKLI